MVGRKVAGLWGGCLFLIRMSFHVLCWGNTVALVCSFLTNNLLFQRSSDRGVSKTIESVYFFIFARCVVELIGGTWSLKRITKYGRESFS